MPLQLAQSNRTIVPWSAVEEIALFPTDNASWFKLSHNRSIGRVAACLLEK